MFDAYLEAITEMAVRRTAETASNVECLGT